MPQNPDTSLAPFGYSQELRRAFRLRTSFGLAFCHISPVVGVYTLFGYGLSTGGPAFVWGLPVVVCGQLLVALVFSELAVSFPLAGALYQWGRRLVGPRYGWLVGWIYGWALIVTIAAVDLGAAPLLSALLGLGGSRGTFVLLALLLLVCHTVANDLGVAGTAVLTAAGVAAEFAATLVLGGALLFSHGTLHPLSILTSRQTAAGVAGASGLLASALAHAWTFYGFEAAAGVAEEVVDPRRRVPSAMILSLLAAAAVTLFLLVALVLATPDLAAAAADPDRAIPTLLEGRFGPVLSRFLLGLLVFAYVSCGAAAQMAATRLLFSYSRDGVLPGSAWLRRVTAHQAPANATLFTALAGGAVVVFSFVDLHLPGGEALNMNALVVSYAVVGIYLSLQSVVLARLLAAARGFRPTEGGGFFSLGRFSIPVAVLALAYGSAMIVNLVWPRPAGSPAGFATLLSAVAVLGSGLLLAYFRRVDPPGDERLSSGESGVSPRRAIP